MENQEKQEIREIELEVNTTLVKVSLTDVKFFDEKLNRVEIARLMGRVSIPQCREYVKGLHESNIYINKETITEQFPVNTIELYQLKQGN